MKISELIKLLRASLKVYGDKKIYPHDFGESLMVEDSYISGKIYPDNVNTGAVLLELINDSDEE